MTFQKLLLATRNPHKAEELRAMLAGPDAPEVVTAADFPEVPDADETGITFEENAVIKALHFAKATSLPALADDSGLVVDALGGRPGIHSARYARDNEQRIRKLLGELSDVTAPRSASFVCAMAFADPDGVIAIAEGKLEGEIAHEAAGDGGFGYDPVFQLKDRGLTLAQVSADEKNEISHRARALAAILPDVAEYFRRKAEAQRP